MYILFTGVTEYDRLSDEYLLFNIILLILKVNHCLYYYQIIKLAIIIMLKICIFSDDILSLC